MPQRIEINHTYRSEYIAWQSMKRRCLPGHAYHARYHDRGIRVCNKWTHSFAAFLEDVGPKPSKAHSLDRVNNDAGYEPGNVRWATRTEQTHNRSKVCAIDGFTVEELLAELDKRGWHVTCSIKSRERNKQ